MSLLHDFSTRRYDSLRESSVQIFRVDREQISGVVQSTVISDYKFVIIQPESNVTLKNNEEVNHVNHAYNDWKEKYKKC